MENPRLLSRIVITTWGSLGDLHPYLAMALELQRRGHEAVVATSACYGAKVECLGSFFEDSIRCAQMLNRRAVIITGPLGARSLSSLPPGVIAAEYAPFAKLFPRAAAIVHHGGVGTTGQAMRSGRPMLVVPCA
jgi:UDP:flavonoid glycosyltransferase YjiC (YdhE family)